MTMTIEQLVADARSRIREICPHELQAWRERDHVVVDVREPGEFVQGHLPGAINLPRGVLEFQILAHPAMACAGPTLERTLLLYCRTGGRSALSTRSLNELGFTGVHSLAGGIDAWRNAGLPLSME